MLVVRGKVEAHFVPLGYLDTKDKSRENYVSMKVTSLETPTICSTARSNTGVSLRGPL